MSAEYNVKLPIFEGPLDLLLHLIKANEMEITEISISQITGQYLDTLRLLETLDLDVAGEFLVMAATLLNIKLRSILPEPEEEIEEGDQEGEGDDYLSARALMQRLIEYRRFKEAALSLGGMAERQALIFVREVALPALHEAQADSNVRGDLNLLLEAFSRVIKFVQRRNYHEVQNEEYTVENKITLVRRRLLLETRITVDELFQQCQAKIEMIVTLIALLELCRLKELTISQIDSYGSIIAYPRREGEEAPASDTAQEAEEIRKIEADILANRTGLVDNSAPPADEEDALLEQVLSSVSKPSATPAEDAASGPEPEFEPELEQAIEIERESELEPEAAEVTGPEPETEAEIERESEFEPEAEAATEDAVVEPEAEPEVAMALAAEPEAEAVTEPATEAEGEIEPEAGAAIEAENELVAEPEFEPQAEAIAEQDNEPEPEAEAVAEPEMESGVETEPEAEAEAAIEPAAEAVTEPGNESELEPEVEIEPEAEAVTEPEAEVEEEVKPVAEPEVEAVTEPEAEPEPAAGAELTEAESNTDDPVVAEPEPLTVETAGAPPGPEPESPKHDPTSFRSEASFFFPGNPSLDPQDPLLVQTSAQEAEPETETQSEESMVEADVTHGGARDGQAEPRFLGPGPVEENLAQAGRPWDEDEALAGDVIAMEEPEDDQEPLDFSDEYFGPGAEAATWISDGGEEETPGSARIIDMTRGPDDPEPQDPAGHDRGDYHP